MTDHVQTVRRNRNMQLLAIASTDLFALLAGTLWLSLRDQHTDQPLQAIVPTPPFPITPAPVVPATENKEKAVHSPKPNRSREMFARNSPGRTRSAPAPSKEALLAKEQLMTALRLASEKLNLAQRKAQGATPGQIRNQHKVG
jgi:hypothetical protein